MSKEKKDKFCPYCGKRLVREDPPLRKAYRSLSGLSTPNKLCRDPRTEQLDKEIERIVEDAIFKVIDARLISMLPFDPDTPDAIKYIESCLEKMKKGEKV